MRQKKTYFIWMAAAAALTLLCSVLALCMGQFRIAPARVLQEIFRPGLSAGIRDNVRTTLFNIRIPRILMSLMAGAGLASSGAAFQSLFANPLATPDTLGVANGASFGAALALLLGGGALEVKALSLACGLAAIVLVRRDPRNGSEEPVHADGHPGGYGHQFPVLGAGVPDQICRRSAGCTAGHHLLADGAFFGYHKKLHALFRAADRSRRPGHLSASISSQRAVPLRG